ncbi:MAG: hypothetical protein ABFC88_12500 [Thermoguttaceae bacterium]
MTLITPEELAERMAYEDGSKAAEALDAMKADPRPLAAKPPSTNVAFIDGEWLGVQPCYTHTYGQLGYLLHDHQQ